MSAVTSPLGMFVSVASDQRFIGYTVCLGRGHQVKLFQRGSGRKTIDGFSKKQAVNPQQTAVEREGALKMRGDITGYVCSGGRTGH